MGVYAMPLFLSIKSAKDVHFPPARWPSIKFSKKKLRPDFTLVFFSIDSAELRRPRINISNLRRLLDN